MVELNAALFDEKQLFQRLSQGDRDAFTRIFEFYEPRLYPFVLKMTRSGTIAEEVVQELFIKLWINRHTASEIESPRSYIFRMAVNRVIEHLKTNARLDRLMSNAANRNPAERNITEENFDAKEIQTLINRAVEHLPPQQRKVYQLSRQQGLTTNEIAAELNLSRSTVKNHLTEALRFIKDYLQKSAGGAIALLIFLMKTGR